MIFAVGVDDSPKGFLGCGLLLSGQLEEIVYERRGKNDTCCVCFFMLGRGGELKYEKQIE